MRKLLAASLVLMILLSLTAMTATASTNVAFTVVFKNNTLPADAGALVEKAGGTVTAMLPEFGVLYATGPVSMMTALNNDKAILTASPSIEFKLAPKQSYWDEALTQGVNPGAAVLYNLYQWDIKQVTNNGASWALGAGSHNTVVGIIDTGISTQHQDLKANLLGGRNFTPDGPGGTVDPADIEDKHGHGSHVAGNIAGNGMILGVGPDLGFRSYRIFGASGGSPSDRIFNAILQAVADKVDVISMSIGGFDGIAGYTWTDPATGIVYKGKDVADFVAYRRVIDYAVKNGVVVVAAAGNEATDIANPAATTAYLNWEYGPYGFYFWGASREVPGTLPGVVTVSATGPDKSLSSYSNYGPGAIDITAPGGDFQRYPVGDWYTDMNLSAYKNGGYVWMAGTSMATPKVSAVAALIIDQAKANGQKLTPAQVVHQLQQTAVENGKPGVDPFFGHGMVNAYTALGGK